MLDKRTWQIFQCHNETLYAPYIFDLYRFSYKTFTGVDILDVATYNEADFKNFSNLIDTVDPIKHVIYQHLDLNCPHIDKNFHVFSLQTMLFETPQSVVVDIDYSSLCFNLDNNKHLIPQSDITGLPKCWLTFDITDNIVDDGYSIKNYLNVVIKMYRKNTTYKLYYILYAPAKDRSVLNMQTLTLEDLRYVKHGCVEEKVKTFMDETVVEIGVKHILIFYTTDKCEYQLTLIVTHEKKSDV